MCGRAAAAAVQEAGRTQARPAATCSDAVDVRFVQLTVYHRCHIADECDIACMAC